MFTLKPSQLTILTTSKCTAKCAHCSMNSSPSRSEKLNFEQIRDMIDQLHELNPLRVVIFAGGEPTLLGEDLLNAIAHAESLSIGTRIVTNASWAKDFERARRQLISLREAGLSELNISADDQHLPFIPFAYVENAWHASKGLKFRAVVIANCHGPRSQITPDYIQERLRERLSMRFDTDGTPLPLPKAAPDGTVYAMSNAYLQRLGRGRDLSDANLFFPAHEDGLAGPCPWAVRSAALSPRNHLVACCGIEAENNSVLDFGDAVHASAGDLVARADSDPIVNAIALRGPWYLKQFLEARCPTVTFRENYATVCEVCEDIVTRPDVVAHLRRLTPELAFTLLSLREGMIDSLPNANAE